MEYFVKQGHWATQKSDCCIVGIFESSVLSDSAKQLDKASQGYLSRLMKREDMTGKIDQTLLLLDVPHLATKRVLLVGCGPKKEFNDSSFRKVLLRAIGIVKGLDAEEVVSMLTELSVNDRDIYWKVRQAVECSENVFYTFDQLKTKKNPVPKLQKIIFSVSRHTERVKGARGLRDGLAITVGMKLTKDLGNLPPNVCTPTYIAQQARALAKQYPGLTVEVLDQTAMEKLKMGALLSVAQGSQQPPQFVVMEYKNRKKKAEKPIVLIGKGVTFDSGGTCLKPAPNMDEMKYDMCGAASVLGTLKAVAELRLPLFVVGIMPLTENMPSGKASRPGDVVTTMSGQTVEILNTDAEGRLILSDALTFSERYKPRTVIDIATLTGAIIVALGSQASGVMSNHDALAKDLQVAGVYSGDRVWQLPLWEEYQEFLSSNFADMSNVGGKEGGSITAACFLSRFAKAFHWAHLDIAGTAWKTGKEKGATGRPVPLLVQYLLDRC